MPVPVTVPTAAFTSASKLSATCMHLALTATGTLATTFSLTTSSRALLLHAVPRPSLSFPFSCRSLSTLRRPQQRRTPPSPAGHAKFRRPFYPSTTCRMATTTSSEAAEWPAQKVRDTFLKYFEERGHTFGM